MISQAINTSNIAISKREKGRWIKGTNNIRMIMMISSKEKKKTQKK